MGLTVYFDGKFIQAEDAGISIWDHGFLYGDGIFEGIRSYAGRVFRLDQHLRRLYRGAHALMISIPLSLDDMREALLETLRRNDLQDSYIRLVVSRGPGDLGLNPRKCHKATVLILADRIKLYPPEVYESGVKMIISSTRKNIPDALSPQIKSLNYLNNIMAKIEANEAGVDEAVMLNGNGLVAECSSENIFIYFRGTLLTPHPCVGLLEGITREAVMELAGLKGIPVREELLTAHDLFVADECFLTGTGAEILPVSSINGRVIGEGRPGSLTRQLCIDYRELTQKEGTSIYPGRKLKRSGRN